MELLPLSSVYKKVLVKVLDVAFEIAKDGLPREIPKEYNSKNLFITTIALVANVNGGFLMPILEPTCQYHCYLVSKNLH